VVRLAPVGVLREPIEPASVVVPEVRVDRIERAFGLLALALQCELDRARERELRALAPAAVRLVERVDELPEHLAFDVASKFARRRRALAELSGHRPGVGALAVPRLPDARQHLPEPVGAEVARAR